MFCVNIALGNTVWRLLFKDETNAQVAFKDCQRADMDNLTLLDDFGQQCFLALPVVGAMFEDLDKAKMANIELFLHQQRVQVAAQKAAQADPGLRASTAMGGPAVLTPFSRNQ